MKKNVKKSAGFYLSVAAGLVSVAGMVLYREVSAKNTAVYWTLAAAVVLEVLIVVLSIVKGIRSEYNILIIISAILAILGPSLSAAPMVREIAVVIAGLNEMKVIYPYITFTVVSLAGWLLFVIASFTGLMSEKE